MNVADRFPEPAGHGIEPELTEPVTEPVTEVVRRPVRMCVRCCAITDTPVVVSEVHVNTGAGFNVYACAECASHFPPLPSVLSLLQATGHSGEKRAR